MALIRKLAKAGIAAKLIDEARKPHNRAKLKRLAANLKAQAARRSQARR